VRLGNAFADMAAGTLTADRPDFARATQAEMAEPSEAEQPEAMTPETALTDAPRDIAETARPTEVTATDPVTAPDAAEIPKSATAAQAVPIARAPPSKTAQAAATAPVQTAAAQPSQVPERVVAEDPETAPLSRSPRPRPRSAEIVAAARPKPAPAAQARGNADRDARAGDATGRQQATARQNGSDGRSEAAGNAAASNYPGLVMRQLSRAGRPRVNARGAAMVAFSIAANGGIASVSLARSSGSAQLDQAALRLVGGAGPFPPPPQGARRSFSVQIQGR
jgi:periplasmic protein TonB